MMVFMPVALVLIGQFCRDWIHKVGLLSVAYQYLKFFVRCRMKFCLQNAFLHLF